MFLSDWSGDFFDFSLRRWLSAKVEDVIHGGTRDHDETGSAELPLAAAAGLLHEPLVSLEAEPL